MLIENGLKTFGIMELLSNDEIFEKIFFFRCFFIFLPNFTFLAFLNFFIDFMGKKCVQMIEGLVID